MRVTILSLLIIFSFAIISCKKDMGDKKICKIEECDVCGDKSDHDKGYIMDKLGNKFDFDRFDTDAQGKYYLDDQGNKLYCDKDATGAFYTNTQGSKVYFDKDKTLSIEKYILSPLVIDEECGYIVSGKIKFVHNGETAAIVDYGDGEIDAWAVKTIYFNKDNKGYDKSNKGGHYGKTCDKGSEYTKCCKFEQKCKNDSPTTTTAISRTDLSN